MLINIATNISTLESTWKIFQLCLQMHLNLWRMKLSS